MIRLNIDAQKVGLKTSKNQLVQFSRNIIIYSKVVVIIFLTRLSLT